MANPGLSEGSAVDTSARSNLNFILEFNLDYSFYNTRDFAPGAAIATGLAIRDTSFAVRGKLSVVCPASLL